MAKRKRNLNVSFRVSEKEREMIERKMDAGNGFPFKKCNQQHESDCPSHQ